MRKPILFAFLLVGPALHAFPAEPPKISGTMFGDFYTVAANHDPDLEGRNGFWFRRIYLTFDEKLADPWAVRLRFEMSAPGDFTSSGKIEPFVKDAYLKYTRGRHSIVLGLSPTPTWEVVEHTWGYRSVEKTPLDLQKFGGSRDLGIAFKGSLDAGKKVRYHLMFANGSGTKGETNKGKKVLGSLGFYPSEHFMLEFYADYDDRPGSTDRTTLQGFAAVKGDRGRLGVLYAHQTRKVEDGPDLQLDIASVFAVLKLSAKADLFARYDRMFDPNPDGAKISYIPFDPTAKSNFLVAGLDLRPGKTIHFMPNVEFVFYDSTEAGKPDTDVIPRLTFYYKF